MFRFTSLNSDLTQLLAYTEHIVENISANSNSVTQWAMTATKLGYTPIAWSISNGWAGNVNNNIESVTRQSGKLALSGYVRSINNSTYTFAITAHILWKKD